jgi:hypothetical protein
MYSYTAVFCARELDGVRWWWWWCGCYLERGCVESAKIRGGVIGVTVIVWARELLVAHLIYLY